MRLSWREHWPWLLVPIGILLALLALNIMLSQDDEFSWSYGDEEEYEYYDGL